MYKGKRIIIKSKKESQQIIHDIHEGIGDSCKSKMMASHRGRDSTYQKCAKRLCWLNMLTDVGEYVKRCKLCQEYEKNSKFCFSKVAICSCAFGSYEAHWGGYLQSTRGKWV